MGRHRCREWRPCILECEGDLKTTRVWRGISGLHFLSVPLSLSAFKSTVKSTCITLTLLSVQLSFRGPLNVIVGCSKAYAERDSDTDLTPSVLLLYFEGPRY